MIERKDVEGLAALARLKVSDSDAALLASDIEAILSYVSDIESVTAGEGGTQKGSVRNVLREDTHPHESGAYTQDLIAAAPSSEKGQIKVKKIITRT